MRKPWNAVNVPVYSLLTKGDDGCNMNICTYVTPITMYPKSFLIGIYDNTKTLENANKSDFVVLQYLSKSQIKWVNALGKKSGFNFDKMAYLRRKDAIVSWKNFEVLKGNFAQLLLLKIDTILTGDHTTFIYEVKHTKNIQDEAPLMLQDLIEAKIIL